MGLWNILVYILPMILFVYIWAKQKYTFWSKQGVPGPSPVILLGNFWEQIRRGQIDTELGWFAKYGKVYGTYFGFKPILTIIDHKLIKQVMVKDFNVFVNRARNQNEHNIWSRALFNIESDDWKRVRTITSPSFTTGKLKAMSWLMNRCVDKLSVYLEKVAQNGNGEFDVKQVSSGFTIDVIATTSFGTETNANGDRSQVNPFVDHGHKLLKLNPLRIIGLILTPLWLKKWLDFTVVFPPASFAFFVDLAKQVMKQRKQSMNKGNDLIQLMMDSHVAESDITAVGYEMLEADAAKYDSSSEPDHQKHHSLQNRLMKSLTENEIIAQCILFFVAGFDTTATTMSNCLFELARNQDVQDRLGHELRTELDHLDPQSDQYYDRVMSHPYLDAVIKETLRKYPTIARLERRVSVDDYQLGPVTLHKDQMVQIAIYAVHHNPEYYPDPERFNPDRFMPENKHLLVPYTFLSFGAGPRNCIAMRYAYQELKLCIAKIVRQFTFVPTEQTPQTQQFVRIGLLSVKPFSLKVVKRIN